MPRGVARSRSRSPYRPSHSHRDRHDRPPSSRNRSRSPRQTHHHHHHSSHASKPSTIPITPVKLPFEARSLTRHDLPIYKPMFAIYLDIQKNLLIEDFVQDELKGRWKSFVGKWNDGKLAEGWYDPQTLEKAIASDSATASGSSKTISNSRPENNSPQIGRGGAGELHDRGQDERVDENEDDDFGPSLPQSNRDLFRQGPSIPKLKDLEDARELATEYALSSSKQASKDLRADRKSEKAVWNSHLEEIAPRAEPGTRDRQLEKRRELAASNRAFASAKTDPTDVELPEADVMGGEEGLIELKRLKETEERKRSEREIRREEVMWAKREEREERLRQMREKEEKTMDMFREIARVRFGAGGAGEGGNG